MYIVYISNAIWRLEVWCGVNCPRIASLTLAYLTLAHPFCHRQRRKQALDESYFLDRFLADFRDLVSWINDMKAIVSADELAKDVAGAEALLERHQEHKVRCRWRACLQSLAVVVMILVWMVLLLVQSDFMLV